ncbi:MAG: RNA pseudouridine synthase, partial [Candidatus Izemoplasmatales bacterium]|nr:RNA pseudouridine synthase [Candidatus Izemoplasmatales bacterium]
MSSISSKTIPILYEDDRLLVVYKPFGLLSHPDKKLKEPDLLTTLRSLRPKLAHVDIQVVTRLDFNTDGIVLISKNKAIQHLLQMANEEDNIKKYYQCVVVGYLPKSEDLLTGYLLKDEQSAVVRISPTELPNTQIIQTGYKVLKEANGLSWIEVLLLTGRTHQIRAHFASIGHPLAGDPLYGNIVKNKQLGLKSQALSMTKLVFNFPEFAH